MKIKLSVWQKCLIAFCFGALLGWGITAYSYMPKYTGDALCLDGTQPDKHGCCTGEIYTDMGELGFNCCPEAGGDCFPPIR